MEDLAGIIRGEEFEPSLMKQTVLDAASPEQVPSGKLPHVDSPSGPYREALARARRENKPLLIDFGAAWCAPCKRFQSETLGDPRVAALLPRLVVLAVDTDQEPGLARAFGVAAIPDVLLAGPEGTILQRWNGFEGPEAFLARLKAVLDE
ncbi:MAG: thioredoxin family protein [Planctomycetota bacterium]